MDREDLRSFKWNQKWINGRLEYIADYKSRINKLSTTLTDMPKGSRQVEDREAELLSTLMDSVSELLEKINQENNKQKEIVNQLDKVKQPHKLLLEKIYIEGKNLVQVANEMNYDYVYVKKMHKKALNKFNELDTKRY